MGSAQHEDTATRRRAVEEWFALAAENARAAVLLASEEGLEKQSLYFTQQSIEATVKGLARGVGIPHAKVRKSGHENVHLLILVLDVIATDTEAAPYLDSLLRRQVIYGKRYKTIDQIQNMRLLSGRIDQAGQRKQEAEKLFEDMLRASPASVKATLDLMVNLDSAADSYLTSNTLIDKITGKPFKLALPVSDDNLARFVSQQIYTQGIRRLRGYKSSRSQRLYIRKMVHRMLTDLIRRNGVERFRSAVKMADYQYWFPKENLARLFDTSKAYTRLLLIGALVWPHESYPRFVAPAGDNTFEQTPKAALGTRHYTADVGVIRYIKDITAQVQGMTLMLEERFTAGALFPYLESVDQEETPVGQE